MTTELKEVISKVEKLGDNEQREIAKMINDEIEWDEAFNNSKSQLSILAQQAINEHLSGKTINEDW